MKRITTILVAMLVAFLMGGSWAWATPPGNETKTGICHRTASDSNPYVFIEVDDNSLQSHLTDTKGHFPKPWKSDGVFRGVAHVAGDLKHDYKAESALDCEDNTPVKPDPEVTVDNETRMSCDIGVESREVTTTVDYVWKDGAWVKSDPVVTYGDWTFVRALTDEELKELECEPVIPPVTTTSTQDKMNCNGVFERTVTVTKLEGEVISREVGEWKLVRELTKSEKAELECKVPVDKPEPPKDEPKADKPEKPVEELAATGASMTYAGLAAALLASGSAMLWFGRRRLTDF